MNKKKGKKKETLLLQMKESLKKFKGRGVLGHQEGVKAVSSTYVAAEMKQVLIAKGNLQRGKDHLQLHR